FRSAGGADRLVAGPLVNLFAKLWNNDAIQNKSNSGRVRPG
ncbi:MAG: hypothetical protein ACI912_001405, partial [Marinobacter psychrophilus]